MWPLLVRTLLRDRDRDTRLYDEEERCLTGFGCVCARALHVGACVCALVEMWVFIYIHTYMYVCRDVGILSLSLH